MTNPGEHIVTAAAALFEQELRRELRTKLMALAEADVEHTIDEVVKRLNTVTRTYEDHMRMQWPVTFHHKEVKRG
jgi:hypothetical protein